MRVGGIAHYAGDRDSRLRVVPKPRSEADAAFVVPVLWLDTQAAPSVETRFGYKLAMESTRTGERKYLTIDSSDPYKIVQPWKEGEYLIKECSSMY